MKPGQTPEPNRLIRLKCHDWSPYEITGMFIKYSHKDPKGRRGQSRFCVQSEQGGNWIAARGHWKDCEEWEYVETAAAGANVNSETVKE